MPYDARRYLTEAFKESTNIIVTASSAPLSPFVIVIVYLALISVSLIPISVVRFPESVDYLNHLARMFILTSPSEHIIRTFYLPDWRLMPNLGLEILVLGFNEFMPLEAAMKASWVFIFISLPAAFVFFYYSVNDRVGSPLLLATLCLFNFPLTAGFLSFSLGLAAALAIVGLWFLVSDRLKLSYLLLFNIMSSIVLIFHLAAFGALALTIVSLNALQAPWTLSAFIRRGLLAACSFLVPLALLIYISSQSAPHFPEFYVWSPSEKLLLLLKPVFSGIPAADILGISALIFSVYVVMRMASVRCDARLAPTLVVWLAALIIIPNQIDNSAAIDTRLVLFPALLFFASLDALRGRLQWIISGVIILSVLTRVMIIKHEWILYNSDITGLRVLGELIDPGSKIFIDRATAGSENCGERFRWPPFYEYTPLLFTIDRSAFVPLLFDKPGMQPIHLRQGLRDSTLKQEDYDYLLMRSINCAKKADNDNGLVLLGQSDGYRLYKIPHFSND